MTPNGQCRLLPTPTVTVFVLTKEDFRKVVERFPLHSKGIREIARERFQNIVEKDSGSQDNETVIACVCACLCVEGVPLFFVLLSWLCYSLGVPADHVHGLEKFQGVSTELWTSIARELNASPHRTLRCAVLVRQRKVPAMIRKTFWREMKMHKDAHAMWQVMTASRAPASTGSSHPS